MFHETSTSTIISTDARTTLFSNDNNIITIIIYVYLYTNYVCTDYVLILLAILYYIKIINKYVYIYIYVCMFKMSPLYCMNK